jgi:multiple sugar transport system substrate-binding protein
MARRIAVLFAAAVACGGTVAACGGGSSGSSGAGSGTRQAEVSGARVIDPSSMDHPPKGTIKYCQGKDTNGAAHAVVAAFNKRFGSQGYKATLTEFPASADQQRAQFIQRQQAKSDDCDVFSSDVIWTAEFASQKWLYDLTPYLKAKASQYLKAPLATTDYGHRYWGVPETTNAGFLYYDTKKVSSPPATWQQVFSQARTKGGFVFQGAPYEGLTVDFLEVAFAAGGSVLSADGSRSTFASPQNVKALQLMVDGVKDGAAPKAVTTYMEPETDQAWMTGKYAFMRNWPYAYAADNTAQSKVRGDYRAAPLPSFEGGSRAGVLGGHNSVISVYTKNPGLALKFADFYASPEFQKTLLLKYSQGAINPATYADPQVKHAIPYSDELRQGIEQAKARPVSPVYPQISEAIYKNVNRALAGRTSARQAIEDASAQIDKALKTF